MTLNIAYYVSGHGFGHAVRSAEVMRRLIDRCPRIHVHVRTTAAPEIFRALTPHVRLAEVHIDAGAVERNPLEVDVRATLERVRELHSRCGAIVAAEADYLRTHAIKTVVADIPFLAAAVAKSAGAPCVLVGNFTWDWIYEPYFAEADARELRAFVRECYAGATVLLKLPFSPAAPHIGRVVDVPLVARRAATTRAAIRELLSLGGDVRPLILVAMRGGLPESLLDHVADRNPDMLFLTLPAPNVPCRDNVRLVAMRDGLGFPELVRASDVVVSKLGYGVVSEAIANGGRLLWPARSNFREDEILGPAAQSRLPAREIPRPDFAAGAWRPHLRRLLESHVATRMPNTDGADVCAQHILKIAAER